MMAPVVPITSLTVRIAIAGCSAARLKNRSPFRRRSAKNIRNSAAEVTAMNWPGLMAWPESFTSASATAKDAMERTMNRMARLLPKCLLSRRSGGLPSRWPEDCKRRV